MRLAQNQMPQINDMQRASKSFRATLLSRDDKHLELLQQWVDDNCAAGVAFHEGEHIIVCATRERSKTKEGFLRSFRSTLNTLKIPAGTLNGRWLSLTTEDVVRAERASHSKAQLASEHDLALPELAPDDDDTRMIVLPSAHARPRAVTRS